jgi:hypothetical protein
MSEATAADLLRLMKEHTNPEDGLCTLHRAAAHFGKATKTSQINGMVGHLVSTHQIEKVQTGIYRVLK